MPTGTTTPSTGTTVPLGNPPAGWVPPRNWQPIAQQRSLYPASWVAGRLGRGPVSPVNQSGGQPTTVAAADNVGTPAHPYEVPFDYRTATLNQQGENLPFGALSWDPQGRPYYGSGLAGQLRGFWSRMTAPVDAQRSYNEINTLRPTVQVPTVPQTISGRAGVGNIQPTETMPIIAAAAEITAQRAANVAPTASGAPSPITYLGRGANEVVRGIMTLFQAPAKGLEHYWMGTAQGLQEAAGAEAFAESPRWMGGMWNAESLGWFTRFLATSSPVAMTYNAARIVTSRRSWSEVRQIIGDNIEAGRIAYSGFYEPAVMDEYIRRLHAGEDPTLLAMELEHPAAEMVGQLVMDPLWLVGIGAKGTVRAGRIASAEREFLTASTDDVARLLDDIGNVASDGLAAERIATLDAAHYAAATRSAERLATQGRDLSAFALTAGGKRAAVSRRVSELASWITHNARDPDEALEVLRGLAASVDADPLVRQAGLSSMFNFAAPRPLFSQAGDELAIVLHDTMSDVARVGGEAERAAGEAVSVAEQAVRAARMREIETVVAERLWPEGRPAVEAGNFEARLAQQEALQAAMTPTERAERAALSGAEAAAVTPARTFNPARFMAEVQAANSPAEILEIANRRLTPVIDRMFPTITQRIAAGEQISPILRGLARFDAVAQSNLYRPVNRFFASIYMGMSPGYAFRNAIQNTFHVFVDYGPRAAGESAVGAVRQIFRPGAFLEEAQTRVSRWLGGQIPEGMARGMTSPAMAAEISGRPGFYNTFLRASERAEQGAASVAVRHTVEDTMRSMLRPGRALPDASALIASGLPREATDTLMRLVVDNYGDVPAAVTAFRGALADGSIEAWRTLSFLPSADIRTLSRIGVDGEIANLLQTARSPQEFREGLAGLLRQVEEEAGQVALEHSGVADDAIHIADAVGLSEGRASGVLSDDAVALAQDRYQAMEDSLNAYEDAVGEFQRRTLYEAGAQGRQAEVEAITRQYDPLIGRTRDVARRTSREFTESVINWRDRIVRMSREGTDWPQVWRNIGIPGEPPAICDYEVVRRALWEQHFYPHQQAFWNTVRESVAEASEAEAHALGGILGMEPNTPLLQQARESLRQSRLWDSAALIGGRPSSLGVMIGRVPEGEAGVRLIAQRFGIPTADAQGRLITGSDAHILNAVNANLPEGIEPFTALRDVPQDVAQQAFRTRAGAVEVAAQVEGPVAGAGGWFSSDRAAAERYATAIPRGGVVSYVDVPVTEVEQYRAATRATTMPADTPQYRQLMTFQENADFFSPELANERRLLTAETPEPAAGFTRLYRGEHEMLVPQGVSAAPIELVPPLTRGAVPSFSRALHENLPGIRQTFQKIGDEVESRWGQTQRLFTNGNIEAELGRWEATATERVAQARLTAGQVGNAWRDFTLLNYQGKRYIDLALGYVYPYQFWYSRTYVHWMQRLAANAPVIAAYARYREYLEHIHAGMPDWWRYSINSNELLGLDSDHPLFFNLEATLNPLNGLTGVDFTDPYRRMNWWTAMLDDLGKFGPSTWTPFSIVTALALHAQGEEEAAARWGGRLIPQTATIQAISGLLGVREGVGLQLDPSVAYFSGGIDPYERRRVGRALGMMVEEGLITSVQAQDAARTHTGDLWTQARARAVNERAPGQLASFFLGVGFRSRSVSDITIDEFYTSYYRLQAMEPNLSPDEYRNSMDRMRAEYPFMDALLLSRPSASVDRDRAYAYNVLSRIPPSQSDDYATWAGIAPELLSAFYENKGHSELWPEQERMSFMAGILDLGTILDLPDTATRSEWSAARNAYDNMLAQGRGLFGDDIWDRVDTYYGARGDSAAQRDTANAILRSDPQIEEAMNFRSLAIIRRPILSTYYGSIRQVESYWRGFMYAQIESELGEGVYATWDQYYQEKLAGTGRTFWNQHPELQRYTEILDEWEPVIARRVVEFAERIPDRPSALLRTDQGVTTYGGQNILGQMEAAAEPQLPQLGLQEWETRLGPSLFNLVGDTINGEELPYAAQTALENIATEMGLSGPEMVIELVRRASLAR